MSVLEDASCSLVPLEAAAAGAAAGAVAGADSDSPAPAVPAALGQHMSLSLTVRDCIADKLVSRDVRVSRQQLQDLLSGSIPFLHFTDLAAACDTPRSRYSQCWTCGLGLGPRCGGSGSL